MPNDGGARTPLLHWSLGLGHLLVIGIWSLVIPTYGHRFICATSSGCAAGPATRYGTFAPAYLRRSNGKIGLPVRSVIVAPASRQIAAGATQSHSFPFTVTAACATPAPTYTASSAADPRIRVFHVV